MGESSRHPSSPGDQSEVIGMDYEWEGPVSYVTLSSSSERTNPHLVVAFSSEFAVFCSTFFWYTMWTRLQE